MTGGTAAGAGETGTFLTTLEQNGTTVSGTFVFVEDGDSGTVSGTAAGQTFTFQLVQTDPASCPGTFSGSATVSGSNRAMSGAFSGESCGGTLSADFFADRR